MRSLSPGHRLTPSTGKACDRWGGEHVNARMYRLISSESPRKCTRFRKTRLSSNAQIFAPPLPLVPPAASLSPSSPGPARIAIPARAREFMRDLRENSRPYARDLIPLILPILPSPSPSPALPIHRAPALNRPNQFRESQSVRKDPIDPYSHSRYDRTTERKKERERERDIEGSVIKFERNGNSVWLLRKLVSPFRAAGRPIIEVGRARETEEERGRVRGGGDGEGGRTRH